MDRTSERFVVWLARVSAFRGDCNELAKQARRYLPFLECFARRQITELHPLHHDLSFLRAKAKGLAVAAGQVGPLRWPPSATQAPSFTAIIQLAHGDSQALARSCTIIGRRFRFLAL